MLADDSLDTHADASPDIGSRLLLVDISLKDTRYRYGGQNIRRRGARKTPYIVALLGLPETNVFGCQPNDIAFIVDDASSSTTGANIDADEVIHQRVDLVPGIHGGLSRDLLGRLKGAHGEGCRCRYKYAATLVLWHRLLPTPFALGVCPTSEVRGSGCVFLAGRPAASQKDYTRALFGSLYRPEKRGNSCFTDKECSLETGEHD